MQKNSKNECKNAKLLIFFYNYSLKQIKKSAKIEFHFLFFKVKMVLLFL